MMTESEDAIGKRDEKKRRVKEASTAIYIDLTKHAIEVQRLDAEANSRAEDNWIMLANLSTTDADQRSWFEKKQTEICQRDV
jgi:hypothetical protein